MRDDIIYNATKIITNSLNWNDRAGGMASVIYGSPCGRAAVKWGQPSSPEYLTNASVFFYYFFLSVDDNLLYTHSYSHTYTSSLLLQ